jgi:hypothetical protein
LAACALAPSIYFLLLPLSRTQLCRVVSSPASHVESFRVCRVISSYLELLQVLSSLASHIKSFRVCQSQLFIEKRSRVADQSPVMRKLCITKVSESFQFTRPIFPGKKRLDGFAVRFSLRRQMNAFNIHQRARHTAILEMNHYSSLHKYHRGHHKKKLHSLIGRSFPASRENATQKCHSIPRLRP